MTANPQRRAFSALEASHPILDCAAAADWEAKLLTSPALVWQAMQQAGAALAQAVRADYAMTRASQRALTALALVGKGHNGGDALIALRHLRAVPSFVSNIIVVLLAPLSELKPNTRRAYELLEASGSVRSVDSTDQLSQILARERIHICLEGALGMSFRPPLRERAAAMICLLNEAPNIDFRAAVDLPSGIGDASDPSPFIADATYATGILKSPLLTAPQAGVLRYLDLGFFTQSPASPTRVLTDRILDPLRSWRPAESEKRRFGHLAILAGSRSMPGALAMSVAAAIRSGVGLVTIFAPESIVAHLACQYPEAMWRSWPETPEGGLALEGLWQIRAFLEKGSALLVGPGMGRDRETQMLIAEIATQWTKPIVLDADALQPEVVDALVAAENKAAILTPHAGEFARLADEDATDAAALRYASAHKVTLIKKGSSTRICGEGHIFLNTTGNGILARGGSGDMLAGLTAGLLAQFPSQPLEAACIGAYWHGKAADCWAIQRGQTAAHAIELVDFLSLSLESGSAWNPNSPASKPFGS